MRSSSLRRRFEKVQLESHAQWTASQLAQIFENRKTVHRDFRIRSCDPHGHSSIRIDLQFRAFRTPKGSIVFDVHCGDMYLRLRAEIAKDPQRGWRVIFGAHHTDPVQTSFISRLAELASFHVEVAAPRSSASSLPATPLPARSSLPASFPSVTPSASLMFPSRRV